jgi:hypothetical protein
MIESLMMGVVVALLLSSVVYFLAGLIIDKIDLPPGGARVAWVVAVLLIVLIWWRFVIAPALGPLP